MSVELSGALAEATLDLTDLLTKDFERWVRQFDSVSRMRELFKDGEALTVSFIQFSAIEFLVRRDNLQELGIPREFNNENLKAISAFVGHLHEKYPEALVTWTQKHSEDYGVGDPRITTIFRLAQDILKNGR